MCSIALLQIEVPGSAVQHCLRRKLTAAKLPSAEYSAQGIECSPFWCLMGYCVGLSVVSAVSSTQSTLYRAICSWRAFSLVRCTSVTTAVLSSSQTPLDSAYLGPRAASGLPLMTHIPLMAKQRRVVVWTKNVPAWVLLSPPPASLRPALLPTCYPPS